MPTRGNTISGLIGAAVGFIVALQSSLISHPGLLTLHHEKHSRFDFLQGGGPSEWGWPVSQRSQGAEEAAAGSDASLRAHDSVDDSLSKQLTNSEERHKRSDGASGSSATPEHGSDGAAVAEGVAKTWLRYLRGCYPLAQSCDPRHFWSTPFLPQPPWALEGAIDPTRVVAGPQVPVDPTAAAVPPKVKS